jgi:hypothetical protein
MELPYLEHGESRSRVIRQSFFAPSSLRLIADYRNLEHISGGQVAEPSRGLVPSPLHRGIVMPFMSGHPII